MISNVNQRTGSNAIGRNNVGAVDPDVAVFQAGRAAGGNLYRRDAWVAGSLGHAAILKQTSWRLARWERLRASRTWPRCGISSRTGRLPGRREANRGPSW